VPWVRGAARPGRPELGLELGGQSPAAQRGLTGELSSAQQRPEVSGWGEDTSDPGLR